MQPTLQQQSPPRDPTCATPAPPSNDSNPNRGETEIKPPTASKHWPGSQPYSQSAKYRHIVARVSPGQCVCACEACRSNVSNTTLSRPPVNTKLPTRGRESATSGRADFQGAHLRSDRAAEDEVPWRRSVASLREMQMYTLDMLMPPRAMCWSR